VCICAHQRSYAPYVCKFEGSGNPTCRTGMQPKSMLLSRFDCDNPERDGDCRRPFTSDGFSEDVEVGTLYLLRDVLCGWSTQRGKTGTL
jgi:hypothetical protein